jgi:hypothetical protein
MPAGVRGFISFHIPPSGISHNGDQPLFHAATGGISFCIHTPFSNRIRRGNFSASVIWQ